MEKEDCLQYTTGIIVPCRSSSSYPQGKCPFPTCRAKEVLADDYQLEKVIGPVLLTGARIIDALSGKRLGEENIQRFVFHVICPH